MPELPEVETIARGVHSRVRGDRVVEVWFASHREPFKTPAARQARVLQGRSILAVHRTGKHIVFELGPAGRGALNERDAQPAAQWIVHLGMTGRLLVTTPEAPVALHTHARLTLASGRELRFVDPRRFGRLEFRDLARAKAFSGPGAEPLTIESADFVRLFRGRRLAIKAALLNQTLLAGVGNIYADESLFRAGFGRARRRGGSPGQSWSVSGWLFARCCYMPSSWAVPPSRTTSTPTGRAGSFSWNIASTSERASPAAPAGHRSAVSSWLDGARITAPIARNSRDFTGVHSECDSRFPRPHLEGIYCFW